MNTTRDTAPQQLAMQYARFVDARAFDRLEEILVPEFTLRGPGYGSASRDEFIASLAILNDYSATFHLVGNQFGDWIDDRYQGETWCVASHIYERDGTQRKLDMGIRYEDTIVRYAERWCYASRDLNLVWTQELPTVL